jgi:hypothetical protein
MSRQPQYSIEARQLDIAGGVAGHMFWVLRDQRGNAVAEMHGLATDRQTGEVLPIGTDSKKHSLRGHIMVHDQEYARNLGVSRTGSTYISEGQQAYTLYSGDKTDVLARWKAGFQALSAINERDLNYPPGGVSPNIGRTVNSNSVYTTLGHIMIDQAPRLSDSIVPGYGNHALPLSRVEEFRFSNRNNGRASVPDEIQVAGLNPDVSANPRVQQAMQALSTVNAESQNPISNDRLGLAATNIAIYSQNPQLADEALNQSRTPLNQIASAAYSKDGNSLLVSDAVDMRNATNQSLVVIPTDRLLSTPRLEDVQQLQETKIASLPPQPANDLNAQVESKKPPSLNA